MVYIKWNCGRYKMKPLSKHLKVKLLDYSPKYNNLGPDAILATSGLLTTKLEDFDEALNKCDEKFIKIFHRESTRRGHASLTTSVNFYFWIEGSKISDFYFSSFPFGSYIISSTRRIVFNEDSILIPEEILNSEFREDYEKVCKELLSTYQKLTKITTVDNARKLLPLSIISNGFFNFTLQTIIGSVKEIERNSEKYPNEVKIILEMIKEECLRKAREVTNAGLELFYDTSFDKQNIFNGELENSDYVDENDESIRFETIYMRKKFFDKIQEFKDILENLKDIKEISNSWKDFVKRIREDIIFRVASSLSLACITDLKRHRTMKQKFENIYDAIDRALLGSRDNFFFPPVERELLDEIEEKYNKSLDLYQKMINNGISKNEAIYIIPLGLKLRFEIFLDGYHIFDPFGFIGVRSCTTADNELVTFVNLIINELRDEGIPYELLGPKCKLLVCPEKKFCSIIKRFNANYNEELHNKF
ncbi:MAG: FAD-dependent thymidylate synthase [Candidatus Aenigmatarchaeota archaeon]